VSAASGSGGGSGGSSGGSSYGRRARETNTNLEAVLPLTALQEAMVLASLTDESDGVYISQVVMELSRVPEPETWWFAWQQVCERHDALRSVFLIKERARPVSVVLRKIDLDHSVTSACDDLDRWLADDRALGFDIESPPLHRHSLVSGIDQGAFRCVHVWTFHHAICDGWSTQIVIDEVFEIYAALTEKRSIELPEPVSLRSWFKARHRDRASAVALDLMRQERVGAVPPTPVPGALAQATSLESSPLRHCTDALSETDWRTLKTTAAHRQVTPSTLVCAAWAMLLASLAREREVCFGVTFAAREKNLSDHLVGMIMHTLPVSCRVDGDASIGSWLKFVDRRIHSLAEAGPLSARQLRELRHAASVADPASAPFYSLISFENVYESEAATGHALKMLSTRYVDQSNLPFSIVVLPGRQLEFRAYYHEGAVSEGLARRLLGLLVQSLRNLTEVDHGLIADWHYLQEHERQQIVFDFSRQGTAVSTTSVLDRIENVCQRYPNRPAIRQGSDKVDYAMLWLQASRVRDVLASIDATCVALAGPASAQLFSAMLGVLMSGRAYVPLDMDWPSQRIHRALQKLTRQGAVVVIADASAVDSVRKTLPDDVPLLSMSDCISGQSKRGATETEDCAAVTTSAATVTNHSTAYVMLTSGSTGEAKAVAVSHAALAASTAARDTVYAVPPARFLLLSSLAFDSSVVGIYWTLCSGGELVLPSVPLARALATVDQLVCHHRITHTLCLPSVHDLLLSQLSARGDHELACVIVAGERCSMALLERHARVLPRVELWNEYGPTESTVWSTAARLFAPEDDGLCDRITIGKPVPGTQLRVLDNYDRPVPIGFYGELLIGGGLLADGYIGDDEANSRQFTEDPLGVGGRMYRSGDLVRWDEEGDLEFGGRLDGQIKVRGVRLEPGDIEAAIVELKMVREAAVVQLTGKSQGEGVRLVAAVVKSTSVQFDLEVLEKNISQILPTAMRPHHVVPMSDLPRLPNGKLDGRKLEQRLHEQLIEAGAQSESRVSDATEQRIAKLAERILAVDGLSATQSLFSAGLDSLRAVQLLFSINTELESRLGIADLYAEPTIAGLADRSRRLQSDSWLRTVSMSSAVHSNHAAPLFFAYGNGHRIAEWVVESVSVHWLIHGRAETVMPTGQFDELAGQHIAQMKRVQPRGPYRLAGFSLGALLVLEIARQLVESGEEIAWLGLIDPTSPRYFVRRGRHQRLYALLKSSLSLKTKCAYVWQFLLRLPEFLYQRQTRVTAGGSDLIVNAERVEGTEIAAQHIDTFDTGTGGPALPIETQGPSHDEIIAGVNQAIDGFTPSKIVCPMALFRVGRGEQFALEWYDDRIIWSELCGHRLDYEQVISSSVHRDFFRDENIATALRAWLRRQPLS